MTGKKLLKGLIDGQNFTKKRFNQAGTQKGLPRPRPLYGPLPLTPPPLITPPLGPPPLSTQPPRDGPL